MSELTDAINRAGPAQVLAEIRPLPVWWPIIAAVKSPTDLIYVVSELGLQTAEQAWAWTTAADQGQMPNRDVWLRLVTPRATVRAADLVSVDWSVLDVARALQCVTTETYWRMNSDRAYLMPTESQLRQIARDCPSWRHQWTGEVSDCDDFVNIARGWLSSNGLGNLAAGKAATVHYQGETLLYGHAVLLAFSREALSAPVKAWWWEPQTGQIHPTSHTRLGAGLFQFPDKAVLAFADF